MGLVARLKSFVRTVRKGSNITDVKCDPGGKPLGTYEHFSAPGDDSFPLVDDYVAAISTPHTGRMSAVGYLDPTNTPKATEGDKRIYARDVDGVSICEVWLKRDGSINLVTPTSSIVLTQQDGINANSINIECDEQTNIVANDTNVFGNFNVDIGVSGIAGPASTITFINGIAVDIT